MNLPFVSRARYEELEYECRRLRLEREVLNGEIDHLRKARLSLIRSVAKQSRTISELIHERDAWHAEAVR
jgi:hypothetical protein